MILKIELLITTHHIQILIWKISNFQIISYIHIEPKSLKFHTEPALAPGVFLTTAVVQVTEARGCTCLECCINPNKPESKVEVV